ncbi:MAG: hypothetical protein GYA14_15910 [Ignavibacteria bacterium]|nr:hypothetical protein [Ignavibacteria bacterium]
MEFEFILTFEEREQEFYSESFDESALNSEQDLFNFVADRITGEEKNELVKISSCIINFDGRQLPDWFITCNGKLYIKNGELY